MRDSELSPQQLAEVCAEAMFSRDHASQGLGMRIESVAPEGGGGPSYPNM